MAGICAVGNVVRRDDKIQAAENSVGAVLNDRAIFPTQYAVYSKAENWGKYQALSQTLLMVKQYIAGTCTMTYSQMKSQVKMWNESSIKNDPVSVEARDQLLKLLGNIKDPELQVRMHEVASVLTLDTTGISLPASPAPVVTMADAAPKAAPLPAVARPGSKAVSVDEWLSDEKIFGKRTEDWNKTENKYDKYYVLKLYLEDLRKYIKGEITESAMKQRTQLWSRHACFNESLSRVARLALMFSLGVSMPENLDSKMSERAQKASSMIPAFEESKSKEAAPAAKVEAPVVDASKVLEALNEPAILGDKFTEYSQTSVKYASHYNLNKSIETLQAYVRGDKSATYQALETIVLRWSRDTSYSGPLSQQARKNLIQILSTQEAALPAGSLKNRVHAALVLFREHIQEHMEIDPVPAPAAKVEATAGETPKADSVQSAYGFDLSEMSAPGGDVISHDRLSAEINRLASEGSRAYRASSSNAFLVKALPTMEFDANGYLIKVTFTQVSVEPANTPGSQVKEMLRSIAGQWRNIRFEANKNFPLGETPSSFGFRAPTH